MPLKVLLADDSAAIQKVMQLSLQDFGVELKAVSSGKDVLDVARTFVPDIAFVDVLLPHKTGYDIASELKADATLKSVPVVMLWSSFMALDQNKFKACGANDQLEKPFESSGLRAMVSRLVPKTSSNPLAKHLEFPKVEVDLATGNVGPSQELFAPPPAAKPAHAGVAPGQPGGDSAWNMSAFEEIPTIDLDADIPLDDPAPPAEASKSFTLPGLSKSAPAQTQEAPSQESQPVGGDNDWVRKDISKFKVPIPEDSIEENTVSFVYSDTAIKSTDFLLKPNDLQNQQGHGAPETLSTESLAVEAPAPAPAPEVHAAPANNNIDQQQITAQITSELRDEIKQQTREIIERVVWKVVPEIAANIIKEELQRLLAEERQ